MSTAQAEAILAFAGYVLDARRRLLIGPDGAPVELSSRAFDTLLYLALHQHEVIDKPRLMKAVWPNRVVEENNLNQQISTLRKVFGETAGEHRFIVTVSGRGYKFVQDVERVEALAVAGAVQADKKPSIAGRLERAPAAARLARAEPTEIEAVHAATAATAASVSAAAGPSFAEPAISPARMRQPRADGAPHGLQP
jgi:DNA-binding winged helix-turn-helix (wHTH) protein